MNPQPAFHQLTFKRGLIYSARFAPDGKNVIYSASWEGQPVQLYSTSPDSPESRPLDLKDSSLFSVSSTGELAVSLGCRFLFFGECVGTLARVSLSGGAPRKIAGDVVSADWTSDGSEIAVIRESGGKFQVEFPLGKVVYENAGWLIDLRVSPRGDAIAFTEHTVRGIDDGRVVVLDRSGKVKVRSEDFNSVEGVAWAAGGSEVWFSGTPQQGWAKEIHALNLEGKDRLILRLPGILRLHDVSSDGRVLLSKENWRTGILFRGPGMDGARDLSWHDGSEVTDISRDGKFVAFAESGEAGGQSFLVYLRGTDGSPAVNLGNGGDPALSPDGNWAAVTVFDANTDSRHIALLPTGAGQSKTLELGQIRSVAMPGWMPDGTQVIFAGYDGHGWRIYVQDINGGKMRAVTPEVRVEPELYQPTSVSPDGKYVFGRDPEGKPWLYPLDMSTPRPVPGIEPGDLWIGWPDDGKSGFVYPGGRVPVQLFRLDLTTGKRQLVTEIAPGDLSGLSDISSVRITPDGKAHAYSYDRCMSELYLVGGLK